MNFYVENAAISMYVCVYGYVAHILLQAKSSDLEMKTWHRTWCIPFIEWTWFYRYNLRKKIQSNCRNVVGILDVVHNVRCMMWKLPHHIQATTKKTMQIPHPMFRIQWHIFIGNGNTFVGNYSIHVELLTIYTTRFIGE